MGKPLASHKGPALSPTILTLKDRCPGAEMLIIAAPFNTSWRPARVEITASGRATIDTCSGTEPESGMHEIQTGTR